MVSDYRDPEDRLQRAVAWFHEGRLELAKDELEALRAMGYHSIQVHLYLGHCALEEEDLAEAARHYRRARQLGPDRAEPILGLGVVAGRGLRFARAIRLLTQATGLHPHMPEVFDNLILCHGALGQLSEAEKAFHGSRRIDPASPHSYYNVAFVYFEGGEIVRARVHWLRVLELAPNYPDVERLVGNCERLLGNLEAARTRLESVLQKNPRDADALADLGHLHEDRQEWQTAVQTYMKTLEVDPRRARVRSRMGDLLYTQGRRAEGFRHLQRAGDEAGSDPDVAERLARALFLEGVPDDARTLLRHAVRDGCDEALARAARGRILLDAGHPARAAAEFRRAARLEPDCVVHRCGLARALAAAGAGERARSVLEEAVALFPRSPDPVRLLGEVALSLGEPRRALRAIEAGLRHCPGDTRLTLQMAESLLRLGRIPQAIAHAAKVRRDGEKGQSTDLLGRAYLALGDSQRAIDLAALLLEEDPGDPRGLLLRGRARLAVGNAASAADDLRRYVRARPGDPAGYREFARCLEDLGRADEAEAQSRIGSLVEGGR